MKNRIILLTQWFDPEPSFKGMVFARELQRIGYQVEVITGFPNYPGGKVYPGYRVKWIQREVIDGVQITRVPLYPSHDQSALKRIFNYVSFAASATIYGVLCAKRAAVLYAYHPPLTVGMAAAVIKFFRRTPIVYDIQDMWPDTLKATGMLSNASALRIVDRICRWVYQRVDHIVVLSPGFKRVLLSRQVPEKKVSVIFNWADETSLSTPAGKLHADFPSDKYFRIVFAGNMGTAQSLDFVLDAAQLLQSRDSRVRWVFIGGGLEVQRLKDETSKRALFNVTFLPAVPMREVGQYLKNADALLVHLRKDPLFAITIPSKTQAYMAVGKPILMGVDGDASELVRESGAGVIAESQNAASIAQAAEFLAKSPQEQLDKMAEKARHYYDEHLSLERGVKQFHDIFQTLIKPCIEGNP